MVVLDRDRNGLCGRFGNGGKEDRSMEGGNRPTNLGDILLLVLLCSNNNMYSVNEKKKLMA